jgi:hypothetical protein
VHLLGKITEKRTFCLGVYIRTSVRLLFCYLVSAIKPYAGFSWISLWEFYGNNCRVFVSFMKITTVTYLLTHLRTHSLTHSLTYLPYLLKDVDELLSEIPHVLTDMGEIWYKRSEYISVEHLWISWKSTQGRPFFIFECRNASILELYIFCLIRTKLGRRNAHHNVLSDCEIFMKIGAQKSFLRAEMNLYSYHPLLISYFNEFLSKISEHNAFWSFFNFVRIGTVKAVLFLWQ